PVCLFFKAEDGIRDSSVTGVQTCALPISPPRPARRGGPPARGDGRRTRPSRSEEHTSELHSHLNLVCRLLLEKKQDKTKTETYRQKHTTCTISAVEAPPQSFSTPPLLLSVYITCSDKFFVDLFIFF